MTNKCFEFVICGVGWGEDADEAWEACKEGLDLDAENIYPKGRYPDGAVGVTYEQIDEEEDA